MLAVARSVQVRDDRGLRLAVVADTHSSPHPSTAQLLHEFQPDGILHAGDIGDRRVLDDLARIAPLFAIRGNIDPLGLPDAMTLDVVHGDVVKLRIFLVHIGVQGPRIRRDVAERAAEEGASLVVCGHSHIPFIGRDRGLTVFNPGSVGPRRFSLPIVFGTIALADDAIRLGHISCETGGPWLPP
jgi:putative phosphoesterase